MKKDIEPKLKLISSYLKTEQEIFVIPEYQRGYSWTILECDKLWQDVGVVNLLGNKILLEEDINKAIGNNWFKTKKQKSINDKTGYKDSRYNIAKALVNYPSDFWTKKEIEDTTLKVAERISNFIFTV